MGRKDVSEFSSSFASLATKKPTRSRRAFTAAILQLLDTKTFNEISVSEILNIAGYSRTAFYANYEDKYDWAKQVVDREMQFYLAYSHDYSTAASLYRSESLIVDLIEKYMQHIYENRKLYDALLTNRIPTPPIEETCRKIEEGFGKTVIGALYCDIEGFDPVFYNYLQLMGSFLHLEYWRLNDYSFTPREMAVKIYAYLQTQAPFVAYRPLFVGSSSS